MKKLKQSHLIHLWEGYEFFLNIPSNFEGSNKPFIFFYYFNDKTNKSERIRRYISKHGGDVKKIKEDAKTLIKDLVDLLKANWNPITNKQNEVSLTVISTIVECADYWYTVRERAYNQKVIGYGCIKSCKTLMKHFKAYLSSKQLLRMRASQISHLHIKDFLDSKGFEHNWGKVTYNTYLVDLGTFFNHLKALRVIPQNPCKLVTKKNVRQDSSRFKIYEKDELVSVANILANDRRYYGLYVASKMVFKYNIRPIELSRIQLSDIDFNKGLLTLQAHKTKNKNEARFQLDAEIIALITDLVQDAPKDWFVFGPRSKASPIQVHPFYFGQNWKFFRKRHKIPSHLKFYALKHTSNYYDIESGASFEEIRQRNRHANLQITTLYIKERLYKNIIKPSSSSLF